MEVLHTSCKPVFGRHETFHPRWGWFSKAVAYSREDPYVFQASDAPLRLGVGKNMVRAIRYWGEASTLLKEVKPPKERLAASSPTLRGEALLNPEFGVDPYLEIQGSLWLLHWWMLHPQPLSMVPIGWFAFNMFRPEQFSATDLEQAFFEACLQSGGDWKPVDTTLARDSSCFLRTYVASAANQIDDALDAPLRELSLIAAIPGQKRRYRFNQPSWIDPRIVLYCCCDFLQTMLHCGNTVTLTRLLHEINSPGKLLRISQDQLIAALSDPRLSSWVSLNDNIGAIQLVLKGPLQEILWKSLADLYECNESQAKHLVDGGDVPLFLADMLVDKVDHAKSTRQTRRKEDNAMPDDLATRKPKPDTAHRMALAVELSAAGLR